MAFESGAGYVSTGALTPPIELPNRLSLYVQHWARPAIREGRPKVQTTGYVYQVFANNRPMLQFHYHPSERVKQCHVHVTARSLDWPNLPKLHIATGRVAFEDVLLMLVEDFRVKAKPGAKELLRRQREEFEERQTWGGARPRR